MAKKNDKTKIGQFIRSLREKKGWTQEELANVLETSQSSIARMENGDQNFTTETLERVSQALNHPIVRLADETSTDFKIRGGGQLSGTIQTNTSKNGAMGLLCAALLNRGKTTLFGIPYIEEVNRILEVLESIGVDIDRDENKLVITPPRHFDLAGINTASASRTRTIIMFLGALIHDQKEFFLPSNQGCKLGKRPVSAHFLGLEKLGVKTRMTNTGYKVRVGMLKAAEIVMYESGDTATENLIIASAKIPGKTTIKFASTNYMVMDVIGFLRVLGVTINVKSHTIEIFGVETIDQDIEYHNSEDPIETMTFLSAAITTNSNITITRCPIDFLELELLKLEVMGAKIKQSKPYFSANGFTKLVDLTTYPSKLKALPDKLAAQPFPGINIDNLPFFAPIATQAQGSTLIHDWTYEDRAIYFTELKRLGADITLMDPHRVYIEGVTKLQPTQMVCPPALRPSVIIMICMLAAEGTSILRNVYSISRGYENIAERLNSIGAKIEVMTGV